MFGRSGVKVAGENVVGESILGVVVVFVLRDVNSSFGMMFDEWMDCWTRGGEIEECNFELDGLVWIQLSECCKCCLRSYFGLCYDVFVVSE